ncbi:hypothetical protein FOZ61_001700 [Perkinsus olseni]|uniref:Protein kinase domain-containing protein n=1 Tax=Perkinsus olseni TaxID=32597 RepID=A0A7J6MBU7_PEROL|nr:hypothetical protein FOZ61_001700 [Perkinsus olseni]KAF4669048.1 hypothetical protein FOL46_001637 [Perkinsus olseni]
MPAGRRETTPGGERTTAKKRRTLQQQREGMEELIGRKISMRVGSRVHNGSIRGVVLYEREHLLDVIWDDGDVELMPHHTARGCLLSEASSEGSPAQDTEGQATTTGKSTRATSTGVKKGRLKGRQPRDRTKQSEPSPKPPSPSSIDEAAPSSLQPSTSNKSAGTSGRVVLVKAHHKSRKTAASECLLPELFIARDPRQLTCEPSRISEGPRSWLSEDEDTTLALRRVSHAHSLDQMDLWPSVLRALLRFTLGTHEMAFADYSCILQLQQRISTSLEEGPHIPAELLTSVQYLCVLAIEVAELTSASAKFSIRHELGYGDYLLNRVVRTGEEGHALHATSLWFDGPEGFTTQEACRAFERRLVLDSEDHHHDDDDEIVSPTNRPNPELIMGRVLDRLPADGAFKPLSKPVNDLTRVEVPHSPLDYTLVVDSCQDAALRRYVRRSHDFMPSSEEKTIKHSLRDLRSFVKRKTAPRRYTEAPGAAADPETYLRDLALTNGGIMNISSVTAGCTSRPQAVLFKALCDANGIACRLVRQKTGEYYNSVLIRDRSIGDDELSDAGELEDDALQDGHPLMAFTDDDEEDEDDSDFEAPSVTSGESGADDDGSATHKVLETVCPVLWPPSVGDTPSPSPASSPESSLDVFSGVQEACKHPLDRLITDAGSATSRRSLDLDKYFEYTTRIGKGSFGEVWRVKLIPSEEHTDCEALLAHPSGSGEYALKMVPEAHIDEEEGELMRLYCSSGHPCITEVLTVFYGHQRLPSRRKGSHHVERFWCCLMTAEDTSLEVLLKSRDKYVRKRYTASPGATDEEAEEGSAASPPSEEVPVLLDLRFTFRLLIDTAFAMMFLHTSTNNRSYVLHRDLKPANILLSKLPTTESFIYRARLTDFGVARADPGQDTNMTIGLGTEGYIAPEQHSIEYDRPADVWSFGVTLSRICGLDSWRDVAVSTRPQTGRQLLLKSTEPVVKFPPAADPFLCDLCLQCLSRQPLKRPTFREIYRSLLTE